MAVGILDRWWVCTDPLSLVPSPSWFHPLSSLELNKQQKQVCIQGWRVHKSHGCSKICKGECTGFFLSEMQESAWVPGKEKACPFPKTGKTQDHMVLVGIQLAESQVSLLREPTALRVVLQEPVQAAD